MILHLDDLQHGIQAFSHLLFLLVQTPLLELLLSSFAFLILSFAELSIVLRALHALDSGLDYLSCSIPPAWLTVHPSGLWEGFTFPQVWVNCLL